MTNTSGTEKETTILTTAETTQISENAVEVRELTDVDLENVSGALGGDGWGWGWGQPQEHGWGWGWGQPQEHGWGYGYGYGYGHGHNNW